MRIPAIAGGMCLALAMRLVAQGDSSFSESDIEITEARVTLQTVSEDNRLLKEQLGAAQSSIKALTESLTAANSEVEGLRRENSALKLRMEALGIDAVASKDKLEQRLLDAVRNIQILQTEKEQITDQLLRLSEIVIRYVKTAESSDVQARLELENVMRQSNEMLGANPRDAKQVGAVAATLTDGSVISVKEEYSLVVANLGKAQGVKIGMPFQVWRGEQQIGTVQAVDVRENVTGAVIQELVSDKEKIKVGDRLKVDARQ